MSTRRARAFHAWGVGAMVLLLATALPSLGVFLAIDGSRSALRTRALGDNAVTAHSTAVQVASTWRAMDVWVRTVADQPPIVAATARADASATAPLLSGALLEQVPFCRLVVRTADGRELAARQGTMTGCPAGASPLSTSPGRTLSYRFVSPDVAVVDDGADIVRDGRVVGRVQATFPAWGLLPSTFYGKEGSLSLVGSEDFRILAARSAGTIGTTIASADGQRLIRTGRPGATETYAPRLRTDVLTAYEPVAGTSLGVFATIPRSVALADAQVLTRRLQLGLVALAVAALFGAVAVGRVVARRGRALLESEERLRLSLDGAQDYGIFFLDPDGKIVSWNSGAERVMGYKPEEVLGRPVSILHPPVQGVDGLRDPDPTVPGLAKAREFGRYEEEGWRVRKDGTRFWADAILTAIYQDGVLRGFSKVTRDVSARRQLEQQLEQARDAALTSSRSRQEFLANMSHEIRTPLNAVIGMTSLVLDTSLDSLQRDYIETVRTSGEHLLTLINDILDYAKIDAGKLTLETLSFHVRDWLDDTLDLVTAQAHDKGLEIVYDVAPGVPVRVVGDPARLRQVLVNLLSNAVKFTPRGEITVQVDVAHLADEQAGLRFEVRDTGVGIREDRIESMFDPFTQADSSTARVFGGTGLGLAISRQLVTAMGGTLALTSAPGEGTTVAFTVRAAASALESAVDSAAAYADRTAPLAGHRVLIVDDNRANREILQVWTERRGMPCVSVAGPAEALELLATDTDFSFALLDFMMPGMDGAQLGERVRTLAPDTHLILLSSAGPYAQEVAKGGTFQAILTKPARCEKLFDLMAAILRDGCAPVHAATLAESAFDLAGATHPLSVLVVDDTAVNQTVAQHLLNRFGHPCDIASSGAQALSALERRDYDLVLMDVQMPQMDGLEATRLIRSRWPERPVRIVAMTANVAAEDIRACLDAGMDGFLGKPIVVDALADVLRQPPDRGVPHVPAPAPAPTSAVAADALENLARLIGADGVRQVVEMFLEALEEAFPRILDGYQVRDRKQIAGAAHRLKASAMQLGAENFGNLLDDLERQAPAADWPHLHDLIVDLQAQHDATHDQLRAQLN